MSHSSVLPVPCLENDAIFTSFEYYIRGHSDTSSIELCQYYCQLNSDCNFFKYFWTGTGSPYEGECELFTDHSGIRDNPVTTVGPKFC